MQALRSWLGFLGTLALASLPAPAGAQAVGSEFQINTYTPSDQFTYAGEVVAADASGNFVVVWDSTYQDGSRDGIFGQRFDSAGTALGSEFRVNSFTESYQGSPASTATKGSFAWTVTGPASATARVRVSWTGNPAVSDASDVTFQIRPAPLTP